MNDINAAWQRDREAVRKFFTEKQRQGLSLDVSPWVTVAPGIELQKLIVEGVIREGMHALDIGCGIGIESVYLAKQGLMVTGIDFIPGTIEVADHLAGILSADARFVCADFLEMDMSDYKGRFNLVLDQGCFHHIPIIERPFYARRVYDVLTDDGLFFLRGFSDQMLPSPADDGPVRLTSDAIVSTFFPLFAVESLYRFRNIPLPRSNKPQIFWSFLARKRQSPIAASTHITSNLDN